MDDLTARLGLPYLAAGQLQKHVTLNEALTRLDGLVATAVMSRTVVDEPEAPADGDLYIMAEAATGADWSTRAPGELMRFEAGGWLTVPAPVGLLVLVRDAGQLVVRQTHGWVSLAAALGPLQNLPQLGVGTTADANNPLSVRADKVLFSTADGDMRFTLNKQAPADVLSLLFQSGWSGRAEIGLVGDDQLGIKVSADGASWNRALSIDGQSGRVLFDQGATRRETTTFLASGSYVVPAWARWVEALVVGGGGGGGSGLSGAANTARRGGGGGGAGGSARRLWPAASLTAGVSVTVGQGGSGGSAGSAGTDGGDTGIATADQVLLRSSGGAGGADVGGGGGLGEVPGNGGGAPSLYAPGGTGQSTLCPYGAGGGGAGGSLAANNTAQASGSGGAGDWTGQRLAGGAGRTTAGQPGGDASNPEIGWAGAGGGGGGASPTGSGYAGGDGGQAGAGGGGGGAGLTVGGAGGNGAAGLVLLTAIG